MPKKIRPLAISRADPELHRCTEKAGAAATKKRKSPLTDGDILFLAEVACSNTRLMGGWPVCDENGALPLAKKEEMSADEGKKLAWIFYRDPVGAARAIEAAHKEGERIKCTALWAVRSVIRMWPMFEALRKAIAAQDGKNFKPTEFDIESISAAVKSKTNFNVTDKLIHKAIRQERDFATPGGNRLFPSE